MNAQQTNVEQESPPPRSRLYPLKPIGVGTSQVESLTSYMARLAGEYHVTPKEFVMEIILPAQGRAGTTPNHYYRLRDFWKKGSSSLNGITSVASEWVDTLQAMTSCDTLRYTTMLTWCKVLAVNGILRPSKAWCPHCYEKWRQNAEVVYEPLLWALKGVEICPQHQQLLVSKCPHCQKTVPFLTQCSRPGYCAHCAGWLGSALAEERESVSVSTTERCIQQQWIAEAVGELLEAAPKLSLSPPKAQIATMMRNCVSHYARGNMRGFGRLLGINDNLPWLYIEQGQVPSLKNLLRICSVLAIKPLEFLTATTLTTTTSLHLVMSQLPRVSLCMGKPATREEIECMQHALEIILSQDFHPPLNPLFVAQHLGCSVSTIRKHCPEQFQALMMRFRPNFATSMSRERLREALEKALESGEVKPLEAIAKEERCSTSVLSKYFPDLSQEVVNRFRNRINHDQIQCRFQEVLASSEPVPSVAALARQMGYERKTIQAAFPVLCQEVDTRRRTERKKQHENRIATACANVRQGVLTLHQQGVYPGSHQVANLLGKPHVVRERKVLETWQAMLEELGYREKCFG